MAIANPIKQLGDCKFGFFSSNPTAGTWRKGDRIFREQYWVYCSKSGTFETFSHTVNTYNGLPNLLPSGDISSLGHGYYLEVSAGFAAGDLKVLSCSNDTGSSSSNASCSAGSYNLYVPNVGDYSVGDYVQVSSGWPSTTYPYRVNSIVTGSGILVLSVLSTAPSSTIAVTQCRGITLSANATSDQTGVTAQTVDPTFSAQLCSLGGINLYGVSTSPASQPAHIADAAAAAGANPTKAEYDDLVTKFNTVLARLESFGMSATE